MENARFRWYAKSILFTFHLKWFRRTYFIAFKLKIFFWQIYFLHKTRFIFRIMELKFIWLFIKCLYNKHIVIENTVEQVGSGHLSGNVFSQPEREIEFWKVNQRLQRDLIRPSANINHLRDTLHEFSCPVPYIHTYICYRDMLCWYLTSDNVANWYIFRYDIFG